MNSDSNRIKIGSCANTPASDNAQQQQALFHAQKMHVLGSLVGGMVHDFNNVFAAILLELDLVCQYQTIPQETRQELERVRKSAQRGAELVKRLIAFSRPAHCQKRTVRLQETAAETVALLQRTINRKYQITLAAPSLLWPIHADENQLCLVLISLCLNARDAMPNGGTIHIELANDSISDEQASECKRAGDFARLTVSDAGAGMTPEILKHLFEPCFTTKEHGKGAGLGLSTVDTIVKDHGGWIQADSRLGHGSQFHVFFPRRLPSPDAAGEILTSHPRSNTSLEGNETVLLAHNDGMMRSLMRAVLGYRGYTILEASDGREAAAKIASATAPIDLVLLGMESPSLNTWSALANIKTQKPALPVILCAGTAANAHFKAQAAAAGAQGALPTPFSNPDLVQMVRETLDRRPIIPG